MQLFCKREPSVLFYNASGFIISAYSLILMYNVIRIYHKSCWRQLSHCCLHVCAVSVFGKKSDAVCGFLTYFCAVLRFSELPYAPSLCIEIYSRTSITFWKCIKRGLMGYSRKYPYTATDGFNILTPLAFGNSKMRYPPYPQNSIIVKPPFPSEFPFFVKPFRITKCVPN